MAYDIERLLRQMEDPDDIERRFAAEDLGQCDDRRVIDALIKLLSDESVSVKEAAVESLKMIGGTEVVGKVIPLLESDDPAIRNYAVEILEYAGEASLPALVNLCEAESEDLRKFAVDIIGGIGVKSDSDAYVRCVGLLEDPNTNVAASAAEALGRIGDPAALPFLESKFESAHPWTQCHILMSIASLDGESAHKILSRIDHGKLKAEVGIHLSMARNLLNARSRKVNDVHY